MLPVASTFFHRSRYQSFWALYGPQPQSEQGERRYKHVCLLRFPLPDGMDGWELVTCTFKIRRGLEVAQVRSTIARG